MRIISNSAVLQNEKNEEEIQQMLGIYDENLTKIIKKWNMILLQKYIIIFKMLVFLGFSVCEA